MKQNKAINPLRTREERMKEAKRIFATLDHTDPANANEIAYAHSVYNEATSPAEATAEHPYIASHP